MFHGYRRPDTSGSLFRRIVRKFSRPEIFMNGSPITISRFHDLPSTSEIIISENFGALKISSHTVFGLGMRLRLRYSVC